MVKLDHTYDNEDVMFDPVDNVILRAIDQDNQFLLDGSIRDTLIENGLVEYRITNMSGRNFLAVSPFFFPNDVANWSLHMFLDYCHLYEKLACSLRGLGLALLDGHPWNAVFYFNQSKLVDLGSIVNHRGSGYREFHRYRRLYWCYKFSEAAKSRCFLEKQTAAPGVSLILSDIARRDRFMGYRAKLRRMLGVPAGSSWSKYYDNGSGHYHDVPKENVLKSVLGTYEPKTVYDIGCNTGHYSLICESFGCNVVACDPDPISVDDLYLTIRDRSSTILPLVASLSSLVRAVERVYSRLRPKEVDLVLLLALVHHLVYREGLSFDDIFNTVAGFGARMALMEMVNKKDENVSKWDRVDRKDWYTLENFIRTGKKYFSEAEVFPSCDDSRPIVLFRR